jgi:hypothetical protein
MIELKRAYAKGVLVHQDSATAATSRTPAVTHPTATLAATGNSPTATSAAAAAAADYTANSATGGGQTTESVSLTNDCCTSTINQNQSNTKKRDAKPAGKKKKNKKSPMDPMVTQMEELGKDEREKFAAYHVDDPVEGPYYLVKWIGPPSKATKTETIVIGTNPFPVKKGDWLLKGQWLEKLTGGKNWYTMTKNHGECVVRLQSVLNLDVTMYKYGEGNDFKQGTRSSTIEIAKERGAYRMDEKVRKGLINACQERDSMQEDQDSKTNKKRKVCFDAHLLHIYHPWMHNSFVLYNTETN